MEKTRRLPRSVWALLFLAVASACSPSDGAGTVPSISAPPRPTEEAVSSAADPTVGPAPTPTVKTETSPANQSGSSAPTPTVGAQTKGSGSKGPSRLFVLEGGLFERPIDNGATIPITKGISAEVFLAPYPPTIPSRLAVYLFSPQDQSPIKDGDVVVTHDMRDMEHGGIRITATNAGNGQYIAPLDFFMYGETILDIYVRTGGLQGTAHLVVFVNP